MQGAGFRVQGAGCRVQVAGFRVQGAGFRVQGSGFRVQGSGFTVHGEKPQEGLGERASGQCNCFAVMRSSSEEGSYSRRVDFCITQL